MPVIVKPKVENFISEFIGKRINSPEQRLIQGATALAMQPFIDFQNKKADEETRAVSVARTIGKIIAGTAVGVGVRYGAIYIAKNFSRYTLKEGEKFLTEIKRKSKKDILLPQFDCTKIKITKEEFETKHANATKTIGTLLATGAMVFTNFLIDAPLTAIITDFLTGKISKHIDKKENIKEVKDAKP